MRCDNMIVIIGGMELSCVLRRLTRQHVSFTKRLVGPLGPEDGPLGLTGTCLRNSTVSHQNTAKKEELPVSSLYFVLQRRLTGSMSTF